MNRKRGARIRLIEYHVRPHTPHGGLALYHLDALWHVHTRSSSYDGISPEMSDTLVGQLGIRRCETSTPPREKSPVAGKFSPSARQDPDCEGESQSERRRGSGMTYMRLICLQYSPGLS